MKRLINRWLVLWACGLLLSPASASARPNPQGPVIIGQAYLLASKSAREPSGSIGARPLASAIKPAGFTGPTLHTALFVFPDGSGLYVGFPSASVTTVPFPDGSHFDLFYEPVGAVGIVLRALTKGGPQANPTGTLLLVGSFATGTPLYQGELASYRYPSDYGTGTFSDPERAPPDLGPAHIQLLQGGHLPIANLYYWITTYSQELVLGVPPVGTSGVTPSNNVQNQNGLTYRGSALNSNGSGFAGLFGAIPGEAPAHFYDSVIGTGATGPLELAGQIVGNWDERLSQQLVPQSAFSAGSAAGDAFNWNVNNQGTLGPSNQATTSPDDPPIVEIPEGPDVPDSM